MYVYINKYVRDVTKGQVYTVRGYPHKTFYIYYFIVFLWPMSDACYNFEVVK